MLRTSLLLSVALLAHPAFAQTADIEKDELTLGFTVDGYAAGDCPGKGLFRG